MGRQKKLNSIFGWLKKPASILSLFAAVTSILTWYWVYAKPGEIRIVLPDEVGINRIYGDLSLLVPLTFTNTGAPRTVRHITHILIELEGINPISELPNSLQLRWRKEFKYTNKYKENALYDSLAYVNRQVPFALFGGTSIQKLYEFVQVDTRFPKRYVESFNLTLEVFTESKTFSTKKIYYNCGYLDFGNAADTTSRNYEYCSMKWISK